MKLPRWLITSLWCFIGLASLAAGGWWWVTWPERTMRDFRALINAGQFEQANLMIRNPPQTTKDSIVISGRFWRRHRDEDLLFPDPPTLADRLSARRICKLPGSEAEVIVERARIRGMKKGMACDVRVKID
jgi:hypothetical protein